VPTSPAQGLTFWTKRLDRAAELADRNPHAREVLLFYSRILEFQSRVYEATQVRDIPASGDRFGLRGSVDLDESVRHFPELAAVVQKSGPTKLAEEAGRLRGSSGAQLRQLLEHRLVASDLPDDGGSFFARVLFQPRAERLAHAADAPGQQTVGNKCPYCHSDPQLAVIRPEGDGGKRMLLCSLCQSEWEFRRILCPSCGEEHNDNLPRYSAEGIAAVRVEACDVCKHYLKSVDMTVDGLAVPVVDEIATAPLDLWAVEHGYRKIQLNLMGF
jgi:FdhE protein